MADCPSVCEHLHLPVQSGRRRGAAPHGPPVHGRAYLDARGAPARRRARHQPHDRRHRRLLRRDRGAVRGHARRCCARSASTRSSRPPTRRGPGTPAARLADDVPAAEKRRRLNALLALQEGIGRELNEAWLGRRTEVLVEEVAAPRARPRPIERDDGPTRSPPAAPRLVGRNREHKLVHLDGPAELVGHLVEACRSSAPARTRWSAGSSGSAGHA